MTLKDMLQQYAEHARKAPGLHYVPSFNNNDLNTQDDLIELEEEASRSSLEAAPAPESPMAQSGALISPRTSNKQDESWPMFETGRDIHHVNVRDRTRSAKQLFDTTPGSVWAEIIKGEKLKQQSFRELDRNNDGYLSTTEILVGLRTTREKAAQLMKEADKDGDGRVSEAEYQEMLSKFGSE